MINKKIFSLSGISSEGQRVSRINARVGIKLPDEDQILTISLPVNKHGEVILPAGIDPNITVIDAQIETNQGEFIQKLDISSFQLGDLTENDIPSFEPDAELISVLQPRRPVINANWSRRGKFSVLGLGKYRFEGYQFFAHSITLPNLKKILETFSIDVDTSESWIHISDTVQKSLSLQKYRGGNISFDGAFSIDLSVAKAAVGWVWILTGPKTIIGFREDDPVLEKDINIAIILPIDAVPDVVESATDDQTGKEACSDCNTAPPLDASEAQLIEHAELFNDDPGPFCQPFKNPERILGEKRFSTILRVDQPEIAAAAGIEAKRKAEIFEDAVEGAVENGLGDFQINVDSISNFVATRGNISDVLFSPLSKEKQRKGRQVPSGLTLIDWEGDTSGSQAVSVARGHILEWRVRWRSNGYSLGNVAHTLTLAPRQIKRIMKVDFERRERAIRRESLESADEVDQSTTSARDYADVVSGHLNEWAQGSSKSSTTGAAAGIGFAAPGFAIGGGVTHGSAKSSSQTSGEKNVSASEEQKLRDAIRQHGESIRSLESTIVTEISQEETTEAVSEVISNPNFCHSLTVVYYNILRHLRVDTELGGLTECLFVPFAITPFHETFKVAGKGEFKSPDVQRLIRHHDVFERYLKNKRLKWVLPYLNDYANQFIDINGEETIPDEARTQQHLTSLRGVLSIKLDIHSPLQGDEDEKAIKDLQASASDLKQRAAFLAKYISSAFSPFAPLISKSIADVSSKLSALSPEEREKVFQRDIAPSIAQNFCDKLTLSIKGNPVVADFTLDTYYQQGKTLKVYFSVSRDQLDTITRENIEEVIIKAESNYHLPLYSVANITSAKIKFSTDYYQRSVSTGRIADDLVVVPPNVITNSGIHNTQVMVNDTAQLEFPASAWERRNLRNDIKRDINKLTEHIDSHLHFYHKAIWWMMDRDELYTLLDGYVLSENNGRSIASVVERSPVAILGNTLVFRVARGASINDEERSLEDIFKDYQDDSRKSDPMRISLPTGGLYAQALKDECEACEEHYGNTDWVLEREEVMPQEIDAGLLSSRRAEPQNLTPTDLPDSIINIQNAPAAPAPSGLQGAFNALSNPNNFRDMAGLAGTQANARAAMQSASALASQFGNLATQSHLASKKMDADAAAISRTKQKEDNNEVPDGTTERLAKNLDLGVPELELSPDLEKTFSFAEGNNKEIALETATGKGGHKLSIKPSGSVLQGEGAEYINVSTGSSGSALSRSANPPISVDDPLNSDFIMSHAFFNSYKSEQEYLGAFPNQGPVERIDSKERERAKKRGYIFQANSVVGQHILTEGKGQVRLLTYLIYDFPVGESSIPIEDLKPLSDLLVSRADAFRKLHIGLEIIVLGASDATGNEEDNSQLRLDRANNVAALLQSQKYKITHIEASEGIAPENHNELGRALNRAVTIHERAIKLETKDIKRKAAVIKSIPAIAKAKMKAKASNGDVDASIGLVILELYESNGDLTVLLKDKATEYYDVYVPSVTSDNPLYRADNFFIDMRIHIKKEIEVAPNELLATDAELAAEELVDLLLNISSMTYSGISRHVHYSGLSTFRSTNSVSVMTGEIEKRLNDNNSIYGRASEKISPLIEPYKVRL